MNIKELCKEAHATAVEKGFWDKNRNKSELLMLIVTEIAEACEALRKNNRQISLKEYNENQDKYIKTLAKQGVHLGFQMHEPNRWKKDTFEDEIADVFIRLGDLCEAENIDIEWQIKEKMKYNKTRERLHGKKF